MASENPLRIDISFSSDSDSHPTRALTQTPAASPCPGITTSYCDRESNRCRIAGVWHLFVTYSAILRARFRIRIDLSLNVEPQKINPCSIPLHGVRAILGIECVKR